MDAYDLEEEMNDDVDDEMEVEYRKEFILDAIIELYEQVMVPFKGGEKIIYNPHLFSNLTQDKFILWIISNNVKIAELFENEKSK